jgi:hypothetical protein
VEREADCGYRFALELEKEFPGQVHLAFELPAAPVGCANSVST